MQHRKTSKDTIKTPERKSVLVEPDVKDCIKETLKKHNDNVTAAAEELGVSRQVLARIIDKKTWTASPATISIIREKFNTAA